jgi:chromosome segregation ATPase
MATPTQARVTSTEALETFRAALVIFLSKSKRALDDATDEVRRTRQWVTHDQRVHWEGEFRRRTKKLEQAQQELMSAKLQAAGQKGAQSALMARQMAVQKAQRDLAEAEAKIRRLKSWAQNFDSATDPVIKRVDKLRHTLAEYPKAISHLVTLQKALDAYAEQSRNTQTGSEIASMAAELEIGPDSPIIGEATPDADAPTEAPATETAAANGAETAPDAEASPLPVSAPTPEPTESHT